MIITSYRSYSIQKTKREKWKLFNDTVSSEKSSTNGISLSRNFSGDTIKKWQIRSSIHFPTKSCLTEVSLQNNPNSKTPFLF